VRAATVYTIIETAKLNSLDPEAYLRAVIARIADHPMKRIDERIIVDTISTSWTRAYLLLGIAREAHDSISLENQRSLTVRSVSCGRHRTLTILVTRPYATTLRPSRRETFAGHYLPHVHLGLKKAK
jgi:hypothetical protein